MALQLSPRPLEERLSNLDTSTTQEAVQALRKRDIQGIASPYFKYELENRIVAYFSTRGIDFGESYDYADGRKYLASINKEPLKAVERGMRLQGMPKQFMMQFDDFEKLYFFAGIDSIERVPEDVEAMTPYEIASIYIRAGIDRMAYLHNSILEQHVQKRTVRRGHRIETYKNPWSPPHDTAIRKRLLTKDQIQERMKERIQPLIYSVGRLLKEEDKYTRMEPGLFTIDEEEKEIRLEQINERLGMMLDSLQPNQRRALTKLYGQRVEDYALHS